MNRLTNKDIQEIFRHERPIYSPKTPAKVLAQKAKRRARKKNACPTWVDKKKIDEIYEESVFLSIFTGVPYHVDHIIPLAGKNVCGLHVPWNLRVISAKENQRKGNRL